MFALLLLIQAGVSARPPDTATYATPALRQLVAEASRLNQRVPPRLGSYRVAVESEVSYGLRNGLAARELTSSVEQMASDLSWERTGEFEQHITGYRSQSLGPQFSSLGFFRNAWAVPSLYGNRLALLLGRDSSSEPRRRQKVGADDVTSWAIHPLADDRDRAYRFAGGDTIVSLHVDARTIRIVRLDVTPREGLPDGTVVFTGELDLDAARRHVVRMRGSFAQVARAKTTGVGALARALTRYEAIAFVELVNSEVEGEFWLPQYQRFEGQLMAPILGEGKAIFRIVTTFGKYEIRSSVSDTTAAGPQPMAGDTLEPRPHRLTIATRDSLSMFGRWRSDLGSASSSVSSEDFSDVAPSRWLPSGPPTLELQPEALPDLVRINRVEGLFTGSGITVRFRDAMPGLTARAMVGYAWSEHTVRGRVTADLGRGAWHHSLRAGRSLDPTNDFTNSLDSVSILGALFGQDDYDYVDRRFASILTTRSIGSGDARVRLEAGWANDRNAPARLTRGVFGRDAFLPNRGVDAGDYLRTAVAVEWHPNADAAFLQSGTGASVRLTRGDGQLNFQRLEGRLATRRNIGSWGFALRFDVGVVLGPMPPQQLFELGRELSLPGYEYKAFAGNQAAVVRGLAMYRLGWLRAPVHLYRRLWLPSPAPALAASLQSGWTGASSVDAWRAMQRLVPGARTTGDARASIAVGMRFFGGVVGFDVARPIDHVEPWRVRFKIGSSL